MLPTTDVNFPVNISLSLPHFCNCHFTSLLLLISVTFLLCDTFLWQGVLPGSLGGRIQSQIYQEFDFFSETDSVLFPESCRIWYNHLCFQVSTSKMQLPRPQQRHLSVWGAWGNQALISHTNITVTSVLEQCFFCNFFRSIFCKLMNFALCLTFLFLPRVCKFVWPVISAWQRWCGL